MDIPVQLKTGDNIVTIRFARKDHFDFDRIRITAHEQHAQPARLSSE
jgi:hypothetical protein